MFSFHSLKLLFLKPIIRNHYEDTQGSLNPSVVRLHKRVGKEPIALKLVCTSQFLVNTGFILESTKPSSNFHKKRDLEWQKKVK